MGLAPSFVNYKKGCTRLAAASDKVYQLLAQGRWFSQGTPASSTTKTGRHDIAESGIKHQNSNSCVWLQKTFYLRWCHRLEDYFMISSVTISQSSISGSSIFQDRRKKRVKYLNYNRENLKSAIAALVTGKMTGETAATYYGVPRSTLYRLAKQWKI